MTSSAAPDPVRRPPEPTTAVVPLRDGHTGKTRLAEHLPAAQRGRLVVSLARHVVATLLGTDGIRRVLVVTADPGFVAEALDPDPRLEVLRQPAERPGLNAGVEFGREHVRRHWPTDRLLVVHADLAALSGADTAALLDRSTPVTLAPDRYDLGTNAVLLGPGTEGFRFRFGEDSLARHRREARASGAEAVLVRRDGTAIDLDTEADWSALPPDVRARLRSGIEEPEDARRQEALP
ncbi:2-phospho-L-lactate guanylyltransferase [Occultella glacieicola]|uniref:Phosphoenolpyruvate guanylyltransferase n=1 Tax=Occultella glacieicola TaxID=2518684 RepID=A0ABY2E4F5_9MICO|nr:2-phospho-L-lactate guanylyltransferase [Occultella glacieicola]TDE92723.1 2-phospho-L-lactate guanylyltransferase [Occultella glacieicola]